MTAANRISYSIALALLAVYFPWGGTYLAMKFAVETFPPFLLAGIRFVIAGSLLYLWEVFKGTRAPSITHWRNAAIAGGLMLLGGNSLVAWAEQTVSSGIAALIVGTVPLWMTAMAWLWQKETKPSKRILLGLLLGFSGQILLVSHSLQEASYSAAQAWGCLILTAAAFFWAAGSLYSRQAWLPQSAIMSIALQNLMGGALCLLVGVVTGELGQFDLQQVSARSLWSLTYLIFIGSIVGFSAYIWVLRKATPAIGSTYAYVNPVVAVFLGWLLADEQLTLQTVLAAIIILLSVVLITRTPAPRKTVQTVICNQQQFSGLDGEGI